MYIYIVYLYRYFIYICTCCQLYVAYRVAVAVAVAAAAAAVFLLSLSKSFWKMFHTSPLPFLRPLPKPALRQLARPATKSSFHFHPLLALRVFFYFLFQYTRWQKKVSEVWSGERGEGGGRECAEIRVLCALFSGAFIKCVAQFNCSFNFPSTVTIFRFSFVVFPFFFYFWMRLKAKSPGKSHCENWENCQVSTQKAKAAGKPPARWITVNCSLWTFRFELL